MKKIKYLLILLISIISLSVFAEEVPEIVRRDINTMKWYWTPSSQSSEFIQVVDFTKQQKSTDGKIYLPSMYMKRSNKTWVQGIDWLRIDCDRGILEDLGIYRNGLFTNPVPKIIDDRGMGAVPKFMVCGVQSDRGARIYGYYSHLNDSGYLVSGLIPETIKKSDIAGYVETTIYNYDIFTGKTYVGADFIFDCNAGTVAVKQTSNMLRNVDDAKEGTHLKYMHNSVCAYYNANSQNISNSSSNIQQQSSVVEPVTKSSLSIDDAKAKCIDLGFKPKTEKFGSCVMELLK